MQSKIGLFGGSFNPIHLGHLIIASNFVEEFSLQKCYFIPNNISPFKVSPLIEEIPKQHRLEMLRLAICSDERFEIDTFEIERNEISYSYLTVNYFKNKFPQEELFFLIGDDQATEFTKWKNWEEILENSFLVIARRNSHINPKKDILRKIDNKFHLRIYFLKNPIIEISASKIRQLITTGKDFRYFLPESIYKYIVQNDLYR